MRQPRFLLPTILLCFFAFCTAVSAIVPAMTPAGADKPFELSWFDAENGSMLFTVSDIVRFDWDRQIFELSPEAATRFLALPIAQRKDFAVKDRDGVIYRGRIYRSSATDEGYDGTTILFDQGPLKKLPASPFYVISGGYPTGGGAHDRDRYSERLHQLLVNAGVLKPIADAELPISRLWSGHVWVCEQTLKASAVIFPETFRRGSDAYIHILLYKGPQTDYQFDKLVITANCTAGNGAYQFRKEILSLTPPLLDNGIYVCKFRPWETVVMPVAGDATYAPSIISGPLPRYPKDAANDNREGVVTISVTIEADGKASSADIVAASGHLDIDRAALRAVEKYVFAPCMPGGVAGKGTLKLQFTFSKGKVSQKLLPPDPIRILASPGRMILSFDITAFRLDNGKAVPAGTWKLPERQITLMPEM